MMYSQKLYPVVVQSQMSKDISWMLNNVELKLWMPWVLVAYATNVSASVNFLNFLFYLDFIFIQVFSLNNQIPDYVQSGLKIIFIGLLRYLKL